MILYLLIIFISLSLSLLLKRKWSLSGFNLFSPAGTYAIFWSFIWLIQVINPFGYFIVSIEAVILSFIPVLMIGLGEYLGSNAKQKIIIKQTILTPRVKNLLIGNSVLVIVIAIVSFISIYYMFGNPLSGDVNSIIKDKRVEDGAKIFQSSPLYSILQYFVLSRTFIYINLFLAIPLWRINKTISIMMMGSAIFSSMLLDISWGSRTLLLDCFISVVIFYMMINSKLQLEPYNKQNYGKKVRTINKIIILISIISLGYVGQLITESTRGKSEMIVGDKKIPASLGTLILYYSQTLVTFDQTLDENEATYGLMSFGGVINLLHLSKLYRNENLFIYDVMYDWEIDNPYYGDGGWHKRANTYSWLRYLYSDFGVIGIIIFPLLVGYISGKYYRKIFTNPKDNIFDYVIVIVCFFIVFRSPIIMLFRTNYMVLSIFLVWGIKKISSHYIFPFYNNKTDDKPIY